MADDPNNDTISKASDTHDESAVQAAAEPKAEMPEARPSSTALAHQWSEPKPKAGGYYWGTGRRKTAVARVRIRPGNGIFKVNGREVNDYFNLERDRRRVLAPLDATETRSRLDVLVNTHGGGTTGQADAVVLGIARALMEASREYQTILRDGGFLTRDAREVERKKYGQAGARRRFQFSKR